jgi:hypothetical protein
MDIVSKFNGQNVATTTLIAQLAESKEKRLNKENKKLSTDIEIATAKFNETLLAITAERYEALRQLWWEEEDVTKLRKDRKQ